MGAQGIKICKGCSRSFKPQISDEDMAHLWYTDEQLEQNQEHADMFGHGHLPPPPLQELCEKCASDPDLEMLPGLFGPPRYRRKDPKDKPRRLRVEDSSVATKEPPAGTHQVFTSDGMPMAIEGPLPPQDIIDMMGAAVREVHTKGTIKPVRKVRIIRKKRKPSLWELLFGKKKKP